MNKKLNELKIVNFKQLLAWQHSHQLVLDIYKITNQFPRTEMYGLSSQLRRAAVSVTSNIAEGFSRGTEKDRVHFYQQAFSSLSEIDNQILIAKDLHYISESEYNKLKETVDYASKLLFGLIKSIKQSS